MRTDEEMKQRKLKNKLIKVIERIQEDLEAANYHSQMHLPGAIAEAVEKYAGTQAAINVLEDLEATIVQ